MTCKSARVTLSSAKLTDFLGSFCPEELEGRGDAFSLSMYKHSEVKKYGSRSVCTVL